MSDNIIDFPTNLKRCAHCDWHEACTTGPQPMGRPSAPRRRDLVCSRGQILFRQGDPFETIYLVRAGSAKSVVTSQGGCEQIVGFHFPGDIIGLDALGNPSHRSAAITLESTAVCRIRFSKLNSSEVGSTSQWDALMHVVAEQFSANHHHLLLLGKKSAHARFALFLLEMASKLDVLNQPAREFDLPMSRQDIANYLSMAVETLSRLIADFQQRELIEVSRRFVRILDTNRLLSVADESLDPGRSFA